jgi:hypothetical protein
MINYKASSDLLVFKDVTGVMPSKVEGSDIIEKVQNVVENLDVEGAKLSLDQCCDVRGFSAFILGGLLEVIRENKWYKDYGYPSFKDMVEQGTGISTSAAYDYMNIYRCLIKSGVSWEKLEHIGWTKIRWFAKHLTQDNVDQWIQEAADKNVEQLKSFVKQEVDSVATVAVLPKINPAAMAEVSTQVDAFQDDVTVGQVSTQVDTSAGDSAEEGACPEEGVKAPLVTEASALDTAKFRRFKLYPLQEMNVNDALDKAKEELQTDYDNEALAAICLGYLVGNSPLATCDSGA